MKIPAAEAKCFLSQSHSRATAVLEIPSSSAVIHFEGEKMLLKRCEQRIFLIFLLQTKVR